MSNRVGKLFTKELILNNGRFIPQVGLGCYHLGDDKKDLAREAIETALDAGYKHFDTAGFYKNDKLLGTEVQNHKFMRAFTRADFFISSKIPPSYMEFKKAQTIIKSSVKAVDLGYLDCMMVLWPGNLKASE